MQTPRPTAAAMQSLAQAVDEAAMVGAPADRGITRIGGVVAALAEVSLEMRLAYWGYPHPGSVGDNPLVILAEGREFTVSAVRFDGSRILVDAEPLSVLGAEVVADEDGVVVVTDGG